MQRLSNGTQATTLPVPGAVIGTPGFATPGNAATGTAGATIDPDAYNGQQEELVTVIEAGGLALDKTNNGQLLAALQTLFAARRFAAGSATSTPYLPSSGNARAINSGFTAPVAGNIVAIGCVNVGGTVQPVGCAHQVIINGTVVSSDSTVSSMTNLGVLPIAAGTVCNVEDIYTPGNSGSAFQSVTQWLVWVFLPS